MISFADARLFRMCVSVSVSVACVCVCCVCLAVCVCYVSAYVSGCASTPVLSICACAATQNLQVRNLLALLVQKYKTRSHICTCCRRTCIYVAGVCRGHGVCETVLLLYVSRGSCYVKLWHASTQGRLTHAPDATHSRSRAPVIYLASSYCYISSVLILLYI